MCVAPSRGEPDPEVPLFKGELGGFHQFRLSLECIHGSLGGVPEGQDAKLPGG